MIKRHCMRSAAQQACFCSTSHRLPFVRVGGGAGALVRSTNFAQVINKCTLCKQRADIHVSTGVT